MVPTIIRNSGTGMELRERITFAVMLLVVASAIIVDIMGEPGLIPLDVSSVLSVNLFGVPVVAIDIGIYLLIGSVSWFSGIRGYCSVCTEVQGRQVKHYKIGSLWRIDYVLLWGFYTTVDMLAVYVIGSLIRMNHESRHLDWDEPVYVEDPTQNC